jgi:co-chaperonin GroES (HSP10)
MAKEEPLFQASNKLQRTSIVKNIFPLRDHVIVTDMNFEGRKLSSGIVLLGDDGKTEGIRPRWAKVFKIGPDQKEVSIGQWVLIEHGRWTRGLKIEMDGETFVVRRIDPSCIIMMQDEEPDSDDSISTAVQAQRKTRD